MSCCPACSLPYTVAHSVPWPFTALLYAKKERRLVLSPPSEYLHSFRTYRGLIPYIKRGVKFSYSLVCPLLLRDLEIHVRFSYSLFALYVAFGAVVVPPTTAIVGLWKFLVRESYRCSGDTLYMNI